MPVEGGGGVVPGGVHQQFLFLRDILQRGGGEVLGEVEEGLERGLARGQGLSMATLSAWQMGATDTAHVRL